MCCKNLCDAITFYLVFLINLFIYFFEQFKHRKNESSYIRRNRKRNEVYCFNNLKSDKRSLFFIKLKGNTGLELVKQALERGHQVTALVRNPGALEAFSKNENFKVIMIG